MTRSILYVAVDIGCLECDIETVVLGVFSTSEAARAACDARIASYTMPYCGDHSIQVFAVPAIDTVVAVQGEE